MKNHKPNRIPRAAPLILLLIGVGAVESVRAQGIAPGTSAITPTTQAIETGPILDVVPYVLADGYTINLTLIPSLTEFAGYATAPTIANVTGGLNVVQLPVDSAGFHRPPSRHHRERLGQPDRRPRRIDHFPDPDRKRQSAGDWRFADSWASFSKSDQGWPLKRT